MTLPWGRPATFLVGKLCRFRSKTSSTVQSGVPMKRSVVKSMWIFALAVACIAFVTQMLASVSQSQENQTINHSDRKDNANNLMYQQGLKYGQADHTNNQPHQYRLQPNDSDDRRAYEAGYDQGYQNSRGSNGYSAGETGQNASPLRANGNLATQNGLQDGANDGLQDRQAGHSSRATKHRNYEHGNRGYEASFGSKDQYKASYRTAYIQGYDKGYNGQGSDHQ